jgi:hypothetical protein
MSSRPFPDIDEQRLKTSKTDEPHHRSGLSDGHRLAREEQLLGGEAASMRNKLEDCGFSPADDI